MAFGCVLDKWREISKGFELLSELLSMGIWMMDAQLLYYLDKMMGP